MIPCARCGRAAPIAADELQADGAGDPQLLVVVVPPVGWIGADDEHGSIICPDCAEPDEIERWTEDLARADQLVRGDSVF